MPKDDLVWNEERHTPWARVEMYGEPGSAERYLPAARVVLGQMLTHHGVNERAARGEAGGFFHRHAQLPDGARIHALTNDGLHTVRIFPPPEVIENEQPKRPEKDFNPGLYLWVGIRAVGTYKWYSLNTFMVEPATASDGLQGCISPAFGFSGWVEDDLQFNLYGDDSSGYTVQEDAGSSTVDAILDAFQNFEAGDSGTHHGTQVGLKERGQHCFAVDVYDGAKPSGGGPDNGTISSLFFSANGLMLLDFTNVETSNYWLHPYDPEMSDAQNQGGDRDFSGRSDGAPDNSMNGWDQVFWIDPYDYLRKGEFDDRPSMMAVTDYMRSQGYIKQGDDQVLEGKYVLAVQCYDAALHTVSSRAGDPIPSATGFYRSESCDYADYDTDSGGSSLQLEVEVRIGRNSFNERDDEDDDPGPDIPIPGKVFNFTLNCGSSDNRNCVATPLGSTTPFDSCGGDGGLNMAGPSFSQSIEIDVQNQTAELSSVLPVPFFGTAAYSPPVQQKRYDARIYVYGSVFPATDDSTFANLAGPAIWTAMEAMTSGAYGCSLMREITAGEITGLLAAAGGHHDHIYRFDPYSHSVEDLGTYDGVVVDEPSPPRDPNFDWFYRLAIQDQNNCINTMGVLVISTGAAYYEGSQDYLGWPGFDSARDCCK